MIKPVEVAGVPVKPFQTVDDALGEIFCDLQGVKAGVAIAINPEKVLASLDNPQVKDILLDATLPYADGIGVVKALEKKTNQSLCRIPGAELWLKVLSHSVSTQLPVYILGAKPEVSAKTHQSLTAMGVNVVGCQDGYFADENEVIKDIQQKQAKIVIVALGSPKQEMFINKCKAVHADAFYMGVGGSFDVFTGHVKRAPEAWCNLHLEWLYRLLKEPKRIVRQVKLLKFAYLYLFNRL